MPTKKESHLGINTAQANRQTFAGIAPCLPDAAHHSLKPPVTRRRQSFAIEKNGEIVPIPTGVDGPSVITVNPNVVLKETRKRDFSIIDAKSLKRREPAIPFCYGDGSVEDLSILESSRGRQGKYFKVILLRFGSSDRPELTGIPF